VLLSGVDSTFPPPAQLHHLRRVRGHVQRPRLERVLRGEAERRFEESGSPACAPHQQELVLAPQQDELRVVVRAKPVPRRISGVESTLREPRPDRDGATPQPRPLPQEKATARYQASRHGYRGGEGTGPGRAEHGRREQHQRPCGADASKPEFRCSLRATSRFPAEASQFVPQHQVHFVFGGGCARALHDPYSTHHDR
jgi:hypothetical protein